MEGFCPLASGSKGNATLFSTSSTKLLIDCGISTKSLISKLQAFDLDITDIDAVLVTHEHTDHIQGLKRLSLKFDIPLITTHLTAKAIIKTFGECPKFKIFSSNDSFSLGNFEVTPFPISHDAVDPVAFRLSIQDLHVGVCTDLGYASPIVEHHLKGCDYLVLEANHEPDLVMQSLRSDSYKNRVLGRSGHLSNLECCSLLEKISHPNLKHVHLAHLSGECNREELLLQRTEHFLKNQESAVRFSIAYQDKVSIPVYF